MVIFQLGEVDGFMGPLYFVLYIFCVLFLMSSVFIGILNDAYSEANKYVADKVRNWKDFVFNHILHATHFLFHPPFRTLLFGGTFLRHLSVC